MYHVDCTEHGCYEHLPTLLHARNVVRTQHGQCRDVDIFRLSDNRTIETYNNGQRVNVETIRF